MAIDTVGEWIGPSLTFGIGNHDYEYLIWHPASGWCTEPLMMLYLVGIHAIMDGDPVCLLLDRYTTHTPDEVVCVALELGVQIIWVPTEATRTYQPLTRRVSGALNPKGRAKWQRHFMGHYGGKCAKAIAAELLLQSWAELSGSIVTRIP
jgi:hypothetical protein